MKSIGTCVKLLVFSIFMLVLCSCTSTRTVTMQAYNERPPKPVPSPEYALRMPQTIAAKGEKVVVVDPSVHAWGAYDAQGNLVKGGLATAGSGYCPDIKRGCRTSVGSFRIHSLGSFDCKSRKYPIPRGGAPMPYCMYFNGGQGLHGSYDVVDGNESHGCVRMFVQDAEWLRFNFASVGTRVIVKPY